jgi:hypothetical protein
MFDEYGLAATFLLTLLAPMFPVIMLAWLVARLGGPPSPGISPPPAYLVNALHNLSHLPNAFGISPQRALLIASVVLLAVGAGLGWYVYSEATTDSAFAAFDLSRSTAPPSDRVVMTGIAHPEYQVVFGERRRPDHYVPITTTDWKRGDPLVYFMKTQETHYTPSEGGRSYEFSQRTPPFPLTSRGVLITDGLPGPVAEIYRKNNVALAPAPVLLDTDPNRTILILAIICGGGGLYALVRAGRMARRAQA